MKRFIAVLLVLVFTFGIFTVTAFAATYEDTVPNVDFTKAYQNRYGNGSYLVFYYPDEGGYCYLSTDVSTASGLSVTAFVSATGINGQNYRSVGLVSTNGGAYITAEIEPDVIYVRDSIHTGSRTYTSTSSLMDNFKAIYD